MHVHTIQTVARVEMTYGERWAMTVLHVVLSLLKPDERISVLMTMLGANLVQEVDRENEIDAVLGTMEQQIKEQMRENAR
jgi:hypothetical protein